MKKRIVDILKILLIALFVSYHAGSAFFPHSHIIDGKQVTHSHPYMPSANHSHSAAAFYLLQHLNNIVVLAGALFITLSVLLPSFRAVFNSKALVFSGRSLALSSPLRGPPVC